MKKWNRPHLELQFFMANESVSSCYDTTGGTMTVSCSIYGDPNYRVGDHYEDEHGGWHGTCRYASEISYHGLTGNEATGNRAPISGLEISTTITDGTLPNGTYNATWISTWNGTYYHHGTVTVSGVTVSNHS